MMHLFCRDLRIVILLFFQPVFWGRGCHAVTQATLFGVALPPAGGVWFSENCFLGGFCSLAAYPGGFPCLFQESENIGNNFYDIGQSNLFHDT